METSSNPSELPIRKGEEKFASFISVIFHPLLMPTYGFVIVFFTKNYISLFSPLSYKLIVISITFLFTFIFPLVNTLLLYKLGKLKTLKMDSSSERVLPYLGAVIYYYALYFLLKNLEAVFPLFSALILGAACTVFATFIINFKWKISAHMAGIGGIAGAILGVFYSLQLDILYALFPILFISGIIAYARLKLQAHSPTQVYTGFLLGFVAEFLIILYY